MAKFMPCLLCKMYMHWGTGLGSFSFRLYSNIRECRDRVWRFDDVLCCYVQNVFKKTLISFRMSLQWCCPTHTTPRGPRGWASDSGMLACYIKAHITPAFLVPCTQAQCWSTFTAILQDLCVIGAIISMLKQWGLQ